MNAPITLVLIVIQLALIESYKDEKYIDISQVTIHSEPEARYTYYANRNSVQKQQDLHIPSYEMYSKKRLDEIVNKNLINDKADILDRAINDVKRDSAIQICTENIRNGNIENAVNYYQQLKNNSALIDITRVAYNDHGKLQNLKNIIDFGSALPTCSQNEIVYLTLYDLVKENDQLHSPHVMIFYKAIKHCMKNTSLENSLQTSTQNVIKSWSNSIRKSDYNDILTFLRVNSHGQDIRDYYPEVVEKAYAHNLEHTRAILNFIRSTPYIEDKCVCLAALFETMTNNNHLNNSEVLMIAFRLKQIMEMEKYRTIKEYYKNIAVGLQKRFNSSVKNLIWNGRGCTIKSKDHNEYLYSPNNYWHYDNDRRHVFTWRKQHAVDTSYWTISAEEDGRIFTIKNNRYNEYIYAASDRFAFDEGRRNVYSWIPGDYVDQGYWKLTPLDDDDFLIDNTYHNEYFYAADDGHAQDGDRRRVFTYRISREVTSDLKWIINCPPI